MGDWDAAQNAIANNLALIEQLKQGKGEETFSTWQQTEAIYGSLEDSTGIIISQINQVQALQTLGFYRRSPTILATVIQRHSRY